MSKHNYSKDFKKDNVEPEVEETVEVTEEQNVEPEVEETVEVTEEPTPIVGVVANCVKLNVRFIPEQYGKILCVLNESSKVQIDEKESTDEYYKVYTESGIEGYCKKEFITIK